MRLLVGLTLVLAAGLATAAPDAAVTFRDGRTVLVGGKPFFPLGLYYAGEEFEDPTGRLLADLRGYGFNTLGFYRYGTPGWRAELDRAHAAGFKVWVRGANGFDLDVPGTEAAAVEQVRALRGHPALLFWEFQDEPILNKVSVEGARRGYKLVKREDPDHPLLVVEWPGAADRFHLWRGIGDVFATDLYPIPRERKYGRLPNHDITQVRDYLATLRTAHPGKPLMVVLQAWAWDPLKDSEKGYPTVRESRFMAYQAVVHGAGGLLYYGQVHCTKPNPASGLASNAKDPAARKAEFEKCLALNRRFWEGHRPLFRELERAAAVFVLPAARPDAAVTLVGQDPAGERGIEAATRQADGGPYLLAVNADDRARTATFRLPAPAAGAKQVHVLFEGRAVPVTGGTFADRFEPYDVHVYATTPDLPR